MMTAPAEALCIVNVNSSKKYRVLFECCVLLQTPSAKMFWLLPLRDQARSSPDDLNAGRQEECRSGDFTLTASVEARIQFIKYLIQLSAAPWPYLEHKCG